MSKNSYNWLTNAGMILGILSAWLYQRTEVPHVIAIALAVVAAILSVGTYFYDRFFSRSAEKAEVPIAPNIVIANESGAGVAEVKSAPRIDLVLKPRAGNSACGVSGCNAKDPRRPHTRSRFHDGSTA